MNDDESPHPRKEGFFQKAEDGVAVTPLTYTSWGGGSRRRRRSLTTLARSSIFRRHRPFPTTSVFFSLVISFMFTSPDLTHFIDDHGSARAHKFHYITVNLDCDGYNEKDLVGREKKDPPAGNSFAFSLTVGGPCFDLRDVKRFVDLTAAETSDLWLTAQMVGSRLEHFDKASSITFTIQVSVMLCLLTRHVHVKKPASSAAVLTLTSCFSSYENGLIMFWIYLRPGRAGKTVSHVHIHILPRKVRDMEKNGKIYDAIDTKEKELTQKLDLDIERKDRSLEEMAEEANNYRRLFLLDTAN
ncbi:hypothetical protein Nepgr_014191 [Nepenthes gracilis]|uniref:HIT domain-containing protein n=1 Tax=Nepenthes gracilis TaxID=150966 RepID=A0AAD3SIR2_NEPGR|nr:hypothetical protein Nepgr_014191 [Nepenthes gracilis]